MCFLLLWLRWVLDEGDDDTKRDVARQVLTCCDDAALPAAQWKERLTSNLKVVGSIPTSGYSFFLDDHTKTSLRVSFKRRSFNIIPYPS